MFDDLCLPGLTGYVTPPIIRGNWSTIPRPVADGHPPHISREARTGLEAYQQDWLVAGVDVAWQRFRVIAEGERELICREEVGFAETFIFADVHVKVGGGLRKALHPIRQSSGIVKFVHGAGVLCVASS